MKATGQRRPGQYRMLGILALAIGGLLIALIGMATREASNEYGDVEGVGDMQRIFGGQRQFEDRVGAEDAPVQMQVFLDAQNETYRDQFLDTVPALVGGPVSADELKLLYRNRSLSRNATQLSFYGIEAAMIQGFGWQYAYLMFRNQELADEQGLDEEFLTLLAESIESMELAEWKQDFEEGIQTGSRMNAQLQAQDQIAINLEIRDEPAVVVNGPNGTEIVQEAPDLAQMEAAIGEVR